MSNIYRIGLQHLVSRLPRMVARHLDEYRQPPYTFSCGGLLLVLEDVLDVVERVRGKDIGEP